MAKIELLDSYEELVAYTSEIRESLDILHEWLAKKPNFEDYWSYHNLIAGHGQHFALLNLILHRMDYLIEEHKTLERLNPKGVTSSDILTNGGVQQANFINEANFYKLVFQSRKPEAEKFADWVTSEVLPSIRKHGLYATDQLLNDPDLAIAAFQALKEERARKQALEAQMEADKPKVLFANAVSASQTSILIGDFAKLLRQNGLEIGQNRLFIWLRENGFLINRKGDSWNMPTQRSMDRGLFEIKERTHHEPNGTIRISKTTKITGKGQVYFMEKLLAEVA